MSAKRTFSVALMKYLPAILYDAVFQSLVDDTICHSVFKSLQCSNVGVQNSYNGVFCNEIENIYVINIFSLHIAFE